MLRVTMLIDMVVTERVQTKECNQLRLDRVFWGDDRRRLHREKTYAGDRCAYQKPKQRAPRKTYSLFDAGKCHWTIPRRKGVSISLPLLVSGARAARTT